MLFAVALLSYLSYTNLVFHKSAKWDLKPQPGHHCQLRSVCWKGPFQGWGLGSVLTTPPQAKRVAQGLCIAGGLELTRWQTLLPERDLCALCCKSFVVLTPRTGRGASEASVEMQLSTVTGSLTHAADFITMERTRKLPFATLDVGILRILKGRFKY